MERTSIRLGGVEIGSSVMNASGARSAERGEIYELCAVHGGAIVFKSCNRAGLETPENLKNRGVEYFQAIARELIARGKKVVGSVVGASEEEFIDVARHARSRRRQHRRVEPGRRLRDQVGGAVRVLRAPEVAARPSSRRDRMRAGGEGAAARAVRAARNRRPVQVDAHRDRGMRERSAEGPRDRPRDRRKCRVRARALSQAHAFFNESENLLDVVAVGGINTGRDAYIAHLTGARAVQVGSALMKEGAGALGRIDRELDAMLAEHGRKSVSEIVGKVRFAG